MAGSHWVGMDAAIAKITENAAKAEVAAKIVVTRGAAMVEAAAKKNFEGAHGKGMPHVGGDKPNIVTGTLRRSIKHTVTQRTRLGEFAASVGPTVIYGRRVELGYAGGSGRGHQKTRAFPYFVPATRAVREKFDQLALAVWRTVL